MGRKNARTSKVLKEAKSKTSPKVYDLLLRLANVDREDLAELVLKIDYLLEYSSTCIKQRDYKEARATLDKVRGRMDKIINEESQVDISCLEHLYEGISQKCKK
ncbi:MAG: hypothetical protein RSA01_02695 [Clostridium sp.]